MVGSAQVTTRAYSCARISTSGTEKEGFEPSIRVAPDTALAGQRLQPLGHFSRWAEDIGRNATSRERRQSWMRPISSLRFSTLTSIPPSRTS